jgi:hypothetical protein
VDGTILSSPFLVRDGVPRTPTMSPRLKCSCVATNPFESSASLYNKGCSQIDNCGINKRTVQ